MRGEQQGDGRLRHRVLVTGPGEAGRAGLSGTESARFPLQLQSTWCLYVLLLLKEFS